MATPRPITKLATDVVNRIAAGEIIQRPANALKELIENSLDAGSTRINITVKEGGVKLLQIQDNGSGIRKADLPILCERFTTSKIKEFEDLTELGTYGFRGEALASISHVAHLTVTTKTRDSACAWKAAYSEGLMIPVKQGGEAEAVPCAGNDGTLLVIEDLFYNTPTRLKSLKSSGDEYSRLLQVVLTYSIHNSGIAFSCKKANTAASSSADISTVVGASVLDNIGVHFGEVVRRELVLVEVEDARLGVKAKGYFSGANYGAKKSTFMFFINNRLVDCSPLKRAFEAFYGNLLAKGSYPFVYLSLQINPNKVDVNVHPTKREVGFEDQDDIIDLVCAAVGQRLEKASDSRAFTVQTLLPGAPRPDATPARPKSGQGHGHADSPVRTPASTAARKIAPNKLVRTDHQAQTLDGMFTPHVSSDAVGPPDVEVEGEAERPTKRRKGQSDHDPQFAALLAKEAREHAAVRARIAQSECELTSIKELRNEVVEQRHVELDSIVKNHIFVGVADVNSGLSMIQYQTKLYLVNHASISEELFYQLGLRQFGSLVRIKLNPPPPLRELLRLAVDHADGVGATSLSSEEIVDRLSAKLVDSAAMLDEYFSFGISDMGDVESIPLLLPGYMPDLDKLPLFLLRLALEVNWTEEKACFESFLRELAYFYSLAPSPLADEAEGAPVSASQAEERAEEAQQREEREKRQVQHVVWPTAKQYLVAPEGMLKRDVVQVTSLESLYRVFERC